MRLYCDGKLTATAEMDLAVVFRACVPHRVPVGQGRAILKATFVTAHNLEIIKWHTDNESF